MCKECDKRHGFQVGSASIGCDPIDHEDGANEYGDKAMIIDAFVRENHETNAIAEDRRARTAAFLHGRADVTPKCRPHRERPPQNPGRASGTPKCCRAL